MLYSYTHYDNNGVAVKGLSYADVGGLVYNEFIR